MAGCRARGTGQRPDMQDAPRRSLQPGAAAGCSTGCARCCAPLHGSPCIWRRQPLRAHQHTARAISRGSCGRAHRDVVACRHVHVHQRRQLLEQRLGLRRPGRGAARASSSAGDARVHRRRSGCCSWRAGEGELGRQPWAAPGSPGHSADATQRLGTASCGSLLAPHAASAPAVAHQAPATSGAPRSSHQPSQPLQPLAPATNPASLSAPAPAPGPPAPAPGAPA
jgi:hypothetical protein